MYRLCAEAHQKAFSTEISIRKIFIWQAVTLFGKILVNRISYHNEEGYTVMPTINQTNATAYHPLELTVNDAIDVQYLFFGRAHLNEAVT